ncbi:hypothetical protein L6164_035829 [Bauhinia variegata]|uniref:Uncharacterized protein n=1 Tax=Bauhinia variegata TaxID=167791 RepID=A0ACB9KF71_BAUVA|nr:hypothetical protein L6164_035829 [Bauhinia variegata]
MTVKKLTLLIAFFIFASTETAASVFNDVNCTSSRTFSPNSTFHTNLNTLLSFLSSNATGSTRFYNATANGGGGKTSDTVYGLFMCRGDVQAPLCRECVNFATQRIASSCPSAKEAVIWYNECLLRYSDKLFFSTMDEWPRFKSEIPIIDVDGDPGLLHRQNFYSAIGSMLKDLIDEAAKSLQQESNKYAVSQANASNVTTLYGLAQCTPDLATNDCRRCVGDAVIEIATSCCGGSVGVSVQFPSCVVRYETYAFYLHSGTPSTPTTVDGKGKMQTPIIIAIVVPAVVLGILFCFSCFILRIRARKRHEAILRENFGQESTTLDSLQYHLATIQAATNRFSNESGIGKGGFGEVYKGILPDGQEIAVKRLSKRSGQGAEEFKNEYVDEIFCVAISYQGRVDDLLSHAWKHWQDQSLLELLDPTLRESYCESEVAKCFQIGLLCVQQNPEDRPTMGTVASYLSNVSVELPFPEEPAFFMHDRRGSSMVQRDSDSGVLRRIFMDLLSPQIQIRVLSK